MLSKETQNLIRGLSSRNMEHLSRRILAFLGINRHYAQHLIMQELLCADEEELEKVILESLKLESLKLDSLKLPFSDGDRE